MTISYRVKSANQIVLRDVVPGAQPQTTLTIAAGVVVPTTGSHPIDTEAAAASDDLNTITLTNFRPGDVFELLPVSAARVTTVKHGTGNITTDNGEDIVLDALTKIVRFKVDAAGTGVVASLIGTALADPYVHVGSIDASTNPNYPAANAGNVYKISVAGKIGGASGPTVEINDTLLCNVDGSAAGDHATVGANWTILQTNIDPSLYALLSDLAASGGAALIGESGGGTVEAELGFMRLKKTDFVTPEDFDAVGDGATDDGAKLQQALDTGRPIVLTRLYATSTALTAVNKSVSISGIGPTKSGIVDIGVGAGQYVLSIDNTNFTTPVTMAGFSILTAQQTISRALSVKFGAADGEFNRTPHRLTMRDMEIRGRDLDINGRALQGFARGAELTNIIRPRIDNVHIAGRGDGLTQADNTYMDYGWNLLSDYHPTDPNQRASPTDAMFTNCQVYSANVGFRVRGHHEGMIFDHAFAIAVNVGADLYADVPPGVGGTQYPWIVFRDFHANFFQEGIKLEDFFDVFIRNPLLYKWTPAPAAYVSTGIHAINCPRLVIEKPSIVNLTNGVDNQQLNGIVLENCTGAIIDKPMYSGVSVGCQPTGTTTDAEYKRGLWRDLPAFGPTPLEYQDLSSGSNRRRNIVSESSAQNAGIVTVTSATTEIVALDLVDVWKSDEFIVEYWVAAAKDATAEPMTMTISKKAGTAGISMIGQTFASEDQYMLNGVTTIRKAAVLCKVTSSGTLTLKLDGKNIAGNATVAAGDGKIMATLTR